MTFTELYVELALFACRNHKWPPFRQRDLRRPLDVWFPDLFPYHDC